MKTKDLKIEDKEFVIKRMSADEASYICMSRLAPILGSIGVASAGSGDSGGSALVGCLSQLSRDNYNEVIHALFGLVQIRQDNHLFDVVKDGRWMYENVRDDASLYLPLLRESFNWSFVDFFGSVSRTFPGALTVLTELLSTKA